ncbi:hypothetical protein RIF29_37785 [Crotalaria pallida]|uniref:Transcription repressor n=1 Tax=Crotalaria pallida TaxID=3830 RepID=A0AAN9HRQ0_CROPI
MPSTVRTGRRSRNYNLRHLNLCFSNFKHSFTHESPPPPPVSPSSKPSSILIERSIDHNRPSPSSTITSSPIIINNFNSLYDYHHCPLYSPFQPNDEPEPQPEPADYAAIFASQRFFFSSPGPSNSIIQSTTSFSSSSSPLPSQHYLPNKALGIQTSHHNNNLTHSSQVEKTHLRGQSSSRLPLPLDTLDAEVIFNGGWVAVPTYSQDPYLDFRRSMEEMVEASPEVISSWEALHELLLCYLALNSSKSTHKFIVRAFVDLVVSLMSFSDDEGGASGGGAVDVRIM